MSICKKWKPGHGPTDTPPTEVPPGHCENDGSEEFQGHCYKFIGLDNSLSWADAVQSCESIGVSGSAYRLASVHSERESAFIQTMYTHLPGDKQGNMFWLGASDENLEGEWIYVDGEPFDYTHWMDGEPNNKVL